MRFRLLHEWLDDEGWGRDDPGMWPPEMDAARRAEWDVWHQLRDEPRLLELVAHAQGTELQIQQRLRQAYPDALVRTAMMLVELRRKAASKFSRAGEMWFDRQGLEQATAEMVARHKARRFTGRVWDMCCGIGGDSLALADHCDVMSVDLNPLACLRTLWNAEVYGVHDRVTPVVAAVEAITERDGLLHIDPDRRAGGGGRVVRVEDYTPDLAYLQRVITEFRGGAIKVSPAANFGGKFPETEIELISLHGECKEATVWFGELAGEAPCRATVLPAGLTLAGHPLDYQSDLATPLAYVYDPDPAVVRAGLVDAVAEQLGVSRLDEAEEYLTSDTLVDSPFVQAFRVVAELGNNPKELRDYFRTHTYGQVEIKCRHVPTDADAVRRKLSLTGHEPAVVLFVRVQGKTRVLVAERLPRS